MRIAIDIDGTIGRYPTRFAPMMLALKAQGHEIIVLTGAGEQSQREDSLARRGMSKSQAYDELVIVKGTNLEELGTAKAEYMAQWKTDVFIDDFQLYCEKARALNPDMMILKVFE